MGELYIIVVVLGPLLAGRSWLAVVLWLANSAAVLNWYLHNSDIQ